MRASSARCACTSEACKQSACAPTSASAPSPLRTLTQRSLTARSWHTCSYHNGRPPPPPPASQNRLAAIKTALLKRQTRQGGSAGATRALPEEDTAAYAREAAAAEKAQLSFLDSLAANNFQLASVLGDVRAKLDTGAASVGRRLWQRTDAHKSHHIGDNILATAALGTAPLTGVTIAECQTLCAAIDNATIGQCKAIAFARNTADPRDLTLRQCFLLKSIGGCSPASFSAAIWMRRDTDGCTEPTERDNPLCVQLASDRTDLVRATRANTHIHASHARALCVDSAF